MSIREPRPSRVVGEHGSASCNTTDDFVRCCDCGELHVSSNATNAVGAKDNTIAAQHHRHQTSRHILTDCSQFEEFTACLALFPHQPDTLENMSCTIEKFLIQKNSSSRQQKRFTLHMFLLRGCDDSITMYGIRHSRIPQLSCLNLQRHLSEFTHTSKPNKIHTNSKHSNNATAKHVFQKRLLSDRVAPAQDLHERKDPTHRADSTVVL